MVHGERSANRSLAMKQHITRVALSHSLGVAPARAAAAAMRLTTAPVLGFFAGQGESETISNHLRRQRALFSNSRETRKDEENRNQSAGSSSSSTGSSFEGGQGTGSVFRGRFGGTRAEADTATSSSAPRGGGKKYPGAVPDHLKHFPSFWHHRQIKQLEMEQGQSGSSGDGTRVSEYASAPPPDKYQSPQSRAPGQTLYKAERKDIEILSQTDAQYVMPWANENSTILRVVRLSDPVVSPVYRAIRNYRITGGGARGASQNFLKYEKFAYGVACACIFFSLGCWQLERMHYKKRLIDLRARRMSQPVHVLEKSPFPWAKDIGDWEYRVIQTRGVFDHKRELFVGPRVQADRTGNACSNGYLVVTPLLLQDGSTILVNRGFMTSKTLQEREDVEVPGWVRVRGVLETGEVPNQEKSALYLKNEVSTEKFTWLIAEDLARNSGALNYEECAQGFITAYDVFYEEKQQKQKGFTMRRKEDFLIMGFDESTNFGYAMQWFGSGFMMFMLFAGRLFTDLRWKF
ncbi:unnamed protein product [Amoebophrya sp. A25]|nr:unnamed protein product [Amoebophrya sp. A25]|eukprot:GSA25T00013509001.1